MSDDQSSEEYSALSATQPVRVARISLADAMDESTGDSSLGRAAPLAALAALAAPQDGGQTRTERRRGALVALVLALATLFCAPQQPGVATYLSAATQARADYRYDLALADYAQASSASPSDPRPRCATGQVYSLQGLYLQAVAAYRACAALNPAAGAAWLGLGDALARNGDTSGALDAWRRAGVDGDWDGYARLAQRAEGLGQLDEAARWWSQMPQDNEMAQGHLGLLALAQGNTAGARAHFSSLLTSRSAYAAQLRLASVFLYATQTPTSAPVEENIGYALLTLGEPGVALTPLRRAAQLAPQDGLAHAYYGWPLWLLGQRAAARSEVAAGLRYSPALPFVLYAAGEVALTDGKPAVALAEFQSALAVTPNNPALWSAAGDAALVEANYVTAELSYGNAAQESNDPEYAIALTRFYLDHGLGTGPNGQALQVAFSEARRFPTNEPLIFLEGQIYDSFGEQTNAFYLFEQATILAPADPGPWYYLGVYAAANGDVVPAVVDLRTALALQPDGPFAARARHTLAQIDTYTL